MQAVNPNTNFANSGDPEPEGDAFTEPTREELAAYVPRPDASEYDGPRDIDGEPFPSCLRRFEKSRVGIFARVDLALLEKGNDAPALLEKAANALIEMASNGPHYVTENGDLGRFEFSSYSRTARDVRAVFRLCRVALDFLEADFLACEAEEIQHLRRELAAFEQMRGQTA